MFLVSPLVWVLAGGAAVWGIDALRRLGRPRVRAFVLLTTAALIAAWFALGIGYAALLGTTPKSGVRTLVGEEPQVTAAGTQVVLAPDYLASAYEYYAPDGPAAHGLARWDQSSGSGPVEWHDDWLAADASRTLDLIAGGADAFPCLAFVYEPGPYGVGLPYERSADLLAGLLARYPLIHQREFPGRNEHPTLYLFALREGGCETAGAAAAAVGAVR